MFAKDIPFSSDRIAAALSSCDGFVWLDSIGALGFETFSVIAINPLERVSASDCDIDETLSRMKSIQKRLTSNYADGIPGPFKGGMIGYVSYDAASAFEKRFVSRHVVSSAVLEFGFYDTFVVFDHDRNKATVCSLGLRSENFSVTDPSLAEAKVEEVVQLIEASEDLPAVGDRRGARTKLQMNAYQDAVRKTQDYILDGEIYQANISSPIQIEFMETDDLFARYLKLREITTAPHGGFGVFKDRQIASLSPERLFKLSSVGVVTAEPIKGTAARFDEPVDDENARLVLVNSEKDRAENIMIVDLIRNDLSKVCEASSVEVTSLCRVETLPHLYHLVSTVTGRLKAEFDALDLLAALFPGGSITGAPKLRAMEIIDELEDKARGAFCGSLGYMSLDGAADFNIMIRTLDNTEKDCSLWAGAGITLLSDPESEAKEIALKIQNILDTL